MHPTKTSAAIAVCLALVLAGCVTGDQVHQFEPLPALRVRTEDLDEVSPRTATDLLRSAQGEFEAANKAQEDGDKEAALKHYTSMLEMLMAANLDPGIFYNVRKEFARILDSTEQHAGLVDRRREWLTAGGGDRVSGDLSIEFPLPERVLAEIDEIQRLYPKNFQGGLDRSCRYLPYLRAELAKAGLPQDLVWLAMVESQFAPNVTSRAGAAGMWQFMRSTGRRYGLRIDRYVDERFNWQRETQAATAYLKDLRDMFEGDWALAVSAYNMGEHGLQRTLAAAGDERNLWRLMETPAGSQKMREETKKFYAKLLASIIVAKSPETYGFEVNAGPPEETLRVPVKGSYSLAALERSCGMSSGALRRLNPDLVRGVTPPSGEYRIAVPADTAAKVALALNKVPQTRAETVQYGSRTTYTIKRGDTLSGIAKKFRVSSSAIKRANHLRSSRLYVGRKLTIPGKGDTRPAAESPKSFPKGQRREYTIRRGDTLGAIAKAAKVSVKDIKALNGGIEETRLPVGAKLVLPSLSEATAAQYEKTHVVKSGEYPAKIARLYGVDLDDFLVSNRLTVDSRIDVGDKLVVPGTSRPAPTGQSTPDARAMEKVMHKVAKGENPSTIANKYGARTSDFLKWNDLTTKCVIKVGEEYVVHVPADASAKRTDIPKPSQETATLEQPSGSKKILHKVAKGDSPSVIANKYGARTSDFLKWNNLTTKSVIKVGEEYVVFTPGKKASPPQPAKKTTTPQQPSGSNKILHKVASGESPSIIATNYGARTSDFLKWNNLTPQSVIDIGDEYIVYIPIAKASGPEQTQEAADTVHTVSPGQNPTTIARRYGVKVSDLYKWNEWDKDVVIKPGQKVTIHEN